MSTRGEIMWAAICERLCGFGSWQSQGQAMQAELHDLQETLKELQKEKSDLDSKCAILCASLEEAENKIRATNEASSSMRKTLQDEVKMVEAKLEELIAHLDNEQASFTGLLEALQSNYRSLHDQDRAKLAQFEVKKKSLNAT